MILFEPMFFIPILISLFNAILGLLIISKTEEEAEMGWSVWFLWLGLTIISISVTRYVMSSITSIAHAIKVPVIPFFMSYGLISIALLFYHINSVNYRRNLIGYMISLCLFMTYVLGEIEQNTYLITIIPVPFFMVFELILAIKTLWLHSKIKEKRSKQKVARNKKGTKRRVSPVKGNTKRPIKPVRPVRAKRPPPRPK